MPKGRFHVDLQRPSLVDTSLPQPARVGDIDRALVIDLLRLLDYLSDAVPLVFLEYELPRGDLAQEVPAEANPAPMLRPSASPARCLATWRQHTARLKRHN